MVEREDVEHLATARAIRIVPLALDVDWTSPRRATEPARYPAIIGSGLRSVCSTTGVPMNVAPVVPLSFTVR